MSSATEIARALLRCYEVESIERMLQELRGCGGDVAFVDEVRRAFRALRGAPRARTERAAKSKARRQLAALFEK